MAHKNFGECSKWSITPIAPDILSYGYNPYWDAETQSLYLVDYLGNREQLFYRYDYAQNRLYSATLAGGLINPTFALPMIGHNELAASNDKRIVVINWDGVSPTATTVRNITAIEQNPIYASNHLDIGGIDPEGRLVTGTYRTVGCVRTSDVNGTVYVFRQNGDIVPLIQNLDTVAGFAWNKRKKLFYFFDSCTYTIFEYKWSPETGEIRDPRPVYTFPATKTYAILGMDISCNGNLFVGLYLGFEVVEIDPKYV
ncbi:putative sugar lactone lactonase YvrE [Sitodiplosis mosellana]|uniref:putative sugar lactone lactonase YvrE n=1 Tax=Sitodiplosis mosellana TaxID=263140 RepID=UPI002444DE18|nr:putative sugar lactone lactonase YvrE [Sitodiplosis mosellana]